MKRPILQRLHDRLWTEASQRLTRHADIPTGRAAIKNTSSVSASMPWAEFCEAFASGTISSHHFRRSSATREIVETLGPVDARFFVSQIKKWDSSWLTAPSARQVDLWGDPIRWPGILLGCPTAFSPTTLRYLAQALWLKHHKHLKNGTNIAEIGVGFGGLAAMNALVSGACTTLIDLPQVEQSALKMLDENGLRSSAKTSDQASQDAAPFVISNYAFTELNAELQKIYFDRYIRKSKHGMILSNASVFASTIGGLSNDEIVQWFKNEGVSARIETQVEILSPSDVFFGNVLITW